MQVPNVKNVMKDPEKGVTYNIMAYRRLSKDEMVLAIRIYSAQKKGKKPKKGQTIEIITIIGHDE